MRSCKICFIVPPNPTAIEDKIDPHLGLLSIAAVAREAGHKVQYLEWQDDGKLPPEADVYALTAYGVNYGRARDIAWYCQGIYPESTTIIGGPAASALPQECLRDFDAVCIGEGETAFLDFLEKRATGRFYFGRYDAYTRAIPPAYDLVDWDRYSRLVMGQRAFGLMTSRGCPHNCAFCANDRQWAPFRQMTDDAVIESIRYCKDVTGFGAATFWDDAFEIRANAAFLDKIAQEDIIFSYQARGTVNNLNRAIYEAGGRVVFIGLESGDPGLLRKMNKGLTPKQIRDAVWRAQDAGIIARCGIIFGFPGETEKTLERTRKFVEQVRPGQVFLTFFQPFPGTDVWAHPAKYGVTWMADWQKQRFQGKAGWVEASIETPWMSRDDWNRLAPQMAEWWQGLPRVKEADHSWQK